MWAKFRVLGPRVGQFVQFVSASSDTLPFGVQAENFNVSYNLGF